GAHRDPPTIRPRGVAQSVWVPGAGARRRASDRRVLCRGRGPVRELARRQRRGRTGYHRHASRDCQCRLSRDWQAGTRFANYPGEAAVSRTNVEHHAQGWHVMNVEFITSIAMISPHPADSRQLYVDTLGLPLERAAPGDDYHYSE